MQFFLQIPSPFELFPGMLGEASKSSGKDGNGLVHWLVFFAFCVALTEPCKLMLRRNLGMKVINILGTIVSSAIFLAWSFFLLFFILITRSVPTDFGYFDYIWNPYILSFGILIYLLLAFYVLIRGLHEYYQARARDSAIWQELEYRGDSILFRRKASSGVDQHTIQRVIEPRTCFLISLIIFICDFIVGFPLLISAIAFWINEWYQGHYKHLRTKESYMDMRIEMQKANMYFNESATTETKYKVTVDD